MVSLLFTYIYFAAGKELLQSFHQALKKHPDHSDILELVSAFEEVGVWHGFGQLLIYTKLL